MDLYEGSLSKNCGYFLTIRCLGTLNCGYLPLPKHEFSIASQNKQSKAGILAECESIGSVMLQNISQCQHNMVSNLDHKDYLCYDIDMTMIICQCP